MNKTYTINEKWIKASIIGAIWAASEIVLGSFFHNLKIPFSSNILTAIGIVILISASYKWREKGLFWRAGLICALMKTLSPSAVIFGPMIAIFSQALLLEIWTRLIGKNVIGYLTGALFAMTWNLFHKILSFIIFYGFDIVNVYSGLLKWAQKQLNIQTDLVWSPVLILAALYALFGILAGFTGIRVGRKLMAEPPENIVLNKPVNNSLLNRNRQAFSYSTAWLVADLLFIIVALYLLNNTVWLIWSSFITAVTITWVIRYKRALRQLARPRFWLWFVIITMLSAFVFNRMQSLDYSHGLIAGIQMNFRAVMIILGFSVIGTELYNPVIREFFMRTSFRQLPLAMELAFSSLPSMIANVPEWKVIVKNPVMVIYRLISQIEYRLEEARKSLARKIFIINGGIGHGKTTMVQKIAEDLKLQEGWVSGIYSPRIMEQDITKGYDVVDIGTGQRIAFLRRTDIPNEQQIGQYSVTRQGLEAGRAALDACIGSNSKIIVVDEIGRLELDGRGWAQPFTELLSGTQHLLITVRDSFTEQVIQKWNLRNCEIFNVNEKHYSEVMEAIRKGVGDQVNLKI